MVGDESYAGGTSFYKFEAAVQRITGYKHVLPTHQGRAAERILFGCSLQPGDTVPNNTHFDTTRANVEYRGARAIDLLIPEGREPALIHPFKGNMDLVALERLVVRDAKKKKEGASSGKRPPIPMAMLTVTNNSNGGQPVSMANIRGASKICRRHNIPLFLDCARFAENAYFIKTREEGYETKTPLEIAQEMFGYCDGACMSAKKDGMSNIGGFLALNDDVLAQKCKNMLILTEGYPTYGGLAGYDLEALAVGLEEVLHEDYLQYRIRSVEYLGDRLTKAGIPIVQPPGGHAIYIDAKAMLPHIPLDQFPAWALTLALYIEGGIRSVEIGSVMFRGGQGNEQQQKQDESAEESGECRDEKKCHSYDDDDGSSSSSSLELVRLAFPRRVYTQSHVDYVAEVLQYVNSIKDSIRGVSIVEAAPVLPHFTVKMAMVVDNGESVLG